MRVRVVLALDVDAAAWAAEYGVDLADVRADVRAYVTVGVIDHLRGLGMLGPDAD